MINKLNPLINNGMKIAKQDKHAYVNNKVVNEKVDDFNKVQKSGNLSQIRNISGKSITKKSNSLNASAVNRQKNNKIKHDKFNQYLKSNISALENTSNSKNGNAQDIKKEKAIVEQFKSIIMARVLSSSFKEINKNIDNNQIMEHLFEEMVIQSMDKKDNI
ncbi:MAG TPA: hypothetical protein QKA14_00825 [Candidatus Megaira endosymbiont of Hartmannula sinica]|nr:hypothetical protein [Candidatus Megaera endosymbiont of Hartmannula sinica]